MTLEYRFPFWSFRVIGWIIQSPMFDFLTYKNENFIWFNLIFCNFGSPLFSICLFKAEYMLKIVLDALPNTCSRLAFSLKPHTPLSFNDSTNFTISGMNSNISLIPNLSNKELGRFRCFWSEASCYTICDERVC